MFSKLVTSQLSFAAKRCFSTTKQANFRVAVAGAGGGIGQPLSLLLKINPMVTELKLYDLVRTPGVAADLSHIETAAKVTAFEGVDSMKEAFSNIDVIVIPAGVPRKPGMSRDDLFDSNAAVVRDIAKVIAEVSPNAMVLIITNPVNSCLPIACEIMKKAGKLDPKRMFGVTTLDIVRSNAFVGEVTKTNPKDVCVPVIGGHAGITILPLLSQSNVKINLPEDKQVELIKKIQDAGTEVVKAKAGAGSATLSMGYAGARMASSVMRAMSGEKGVVECAYVMSDVTEAKYFASPVLLGKNGVEKNLGLGKLSKMEEEMLKKLLPELKSSIKKGEDFANKS